VKSTATFDGWRNFNYEGQETCYVCSRNGSGRANGPRLVYRIQETSSRRPSRRTTQAQNVKKLKEWTPENAKLWISVLQGLQDDGYLDDPRGILNFDESGFKLAVMISKTIAPRGKQFVQSLTTGSCLSVVSTLIRLSEWLKIP